MRPRRERRGEPGTSPIYATTSTCFNAATARAPWRTDENRHVFEDALPLQCGHGASAVENATTRRHHAGCALASMRPRRERRGERGFSGGLDGLAQSFNAATARAPWRTEIQAGEGGQDSKASMRPRRE